MQIYWIKAQAPRRVLALVKHLGVRAEYIEKDLMAGDLAKEHYVALNPNMKAPALVDGDFCVGILGHHGPSLHQTGFRHVAGPRPCRTGRGHTVALLERQSLGASYFAVYFEHVVKSTFGMGAPDRELLKSKTTEPSQVCERARAIFRGPRNIACDRLTIADFQLASMATDWRNAEIEFEAFLNVVSLDRSTE